MTTLLKRHPIHDVQEFMNSLKVGDTFWAVQTVYEEPCGIQSYTVLGFEVAPDGISWCVLSSYIMDGEEFTRTHHVGDLVNKWHGVCLTEDDANAYLEERKQKFEADPEAKLLSQTRKLLHEYDDSYYDDDPYDNYDPESDD